MVERTARFSGSRWAKLRRWVLNSEPLCRAHKARGELVPAEEVDHIVPLFKGGTNDESNLQPLCRACHVAKSVEELRAERPGVDENGMPLNPFHHWNADR